MTVFVIKVRERIGFAVAEKVFSEPEKTGAGQKYGSRKKRCPACEINSAKRTGNRYQYRGE